MESGFPVFAIQCTPTEDSFIPVDVSEFLINLLGSGVRLRRFATELPRGCFASREAIDQGRLFVSGIEHQIHARRTNSAEPEILNCGRGMPAGNCEQTAVTEVNERSPAGRINALRNHSTPQWKITFSLAHLDGCAWRFPSQRD
jgi:hypothetical protein